MCTVLIIFSMTGSCLDGNSFIHQWLYDPLLVPGLSFCSIFFFIFFTQTVRLLGRMISPSQGRYLHTGQHKHIINSHTDIHALSGIRTHDPNVRASEYSSCLRPRDHCDRRLHKNSNIKLINIAPSLQDTP
jgi:hypothetical protein